MDIVISNSSSEPIYEQIYNQIKELIILGTLKEGDMLPSMRFLAKELRISVITTKRAYEELERSGFIFSLTGKGSFVKSSNTELIKEEYLKSIEQHMREISLKARVCNLSIEELSEMLTIICEEE